MRAGFCKGTIRRPSSQSFFKCWLLILLLAAHLPITFSGGVPGDSAAPPVRLNTVGFIPDHTKRASISAPCTDFKVIDVQSGKPVFRGRVSGPLLNVDTSENLYIADFSALSVPGTYQLNVPGVGDSPTFRISRDVYNAPFRIASQAMDLWRCGAAVNLQENGNVYSHEACHLDDAWMDLVGGGHVKRNSRKGWHDAGDYNKYVVNAGFTLGVMFRAWEEFGTRIQKINYGKEEDTGLPSYLSTIKWETDWLLTMQSADGSVYHKVSTKQFGPAIPPEAEKTERYFAPWSSAATADFVAVMAIAARTFEPFDRKYAADCLKAARRSYAFLNAHTEDHRADLKEFATGAYQTKDGDDRLWADAEMWETTGEVSALTDFESRASNFKFATNWGWSNVENLALLTYLFSKRDGRNGQLVHRLRDDLISTANDIVSVRDAHGYARPLGTIYYWGANGGVANTTLLLQAANRIAPNPAYIDAALDAVSNLLGRNYYGRSFVTGLGSRPPLHPHDRRSMGQRGAPAWPGYLVGGGWPRAVDWKDESENYRVNEIAINWNAGLIYALAGFIE